LNHESTLILKRAESWFDSLGWKVYPFQRETWQAYLENKEGIVNAPTGSGKTYSLLLPIILDIASSENKTGLQAIWITPIRALSKEIEHAAHRLNEAMQLQLTIAVRTGDSTATDKKKLKTHPPHLLITTPESLHILFSQKGYQSYFSKLKVLVADEWHELLGSKRGVQLELALSRLKGISTQFKVWGISATIGNMDESLQVLLGDRYNSKKAVIIKSGNRKKIEVISVMPDEIEKMPWAGHLGINLIDKILPIIHQSKSTLIFTNTRSFAEIWYQQMLAKAPELSGLIAMHHGSISQELRNWVEDALHEGRLKAVVCTSSLDLGVDFRPVENIIQVGSPKGIARFIQRAGRSGHQPGATSRIYFVPTHSLELMEAAALRYAIDENLLEERQPYIRSFDVLIQYLLTLAVSDGFKAEQIFEEVKSCFSYQSLSEDDWQWLLAFITTGGAALTAYDEYQKVIIEEGIYKIDNRKIAMRHRMSIGTIVGDVSMHVQYLSGKYLGSIEEGFISRLNPGDVFWFAGRNLELVRIKDMVVQVRNSKRKSGIVPSWQGGRMPLSSQMSQVIRTQLHDAANNNFSQPELIKLKPLFELQAKRSHLPSASEFLIEYFESKEGHHLLMYPFEGRFVHEGMAAVIAYRLAQMQPISFSIAMNDYGFELLSDQQILVVEALEIDLLGEDNLLRDIQASINKTEMARRKFRDIAAISGLIFKGYPGKYVKDRHLQSSSQLFFNVFHDYENNNLLLKQAYEEVMDFQLEEVRLRKALQRIATQKIILKRPLKPTPFAFPIIVDRLSREKLSSEKLADRVRRMMLQYEK
jgi:ATP-dependent helicase Lhr and Lhr-like helicase